MGTDICYNKNYIFTGAFNLPDGNTYFGKLFYKVNEQCEFLIYTNDFQLQENHINQITATLSDENENIYYVNLFDCTVGVASFASAGNCFRGYFEHALFSKQRFFNSDNENTNEKVNIFLNTWAEFCFPQGYKERASFRPRTNEFKLRNKMLIAFNQDIKGYFLGENNIFNDLFINWGLPDDTINSMEQQLNKLLIPHRREIAIKKAEKHKWYIRVENIPQKLDIYLVSYYLTLMLMCFTHDFKSKVDKIEIVSKDIMQNATIPIIFDYLDYRNIIMGEPNYKYLQSVFNINTFSEKEWKTILNNLFSRSKTLEPFFDIIYQNHYECKLSEYHLERYIDCIAAIGNNKKYGDYKYERVLKDFISDLDSDIKNQLLTEFKNALKNITAKNKKKQRRNWGLIGKKICELRAMTTHFNETSKRISIEKYISIYFILELVIIDYIFELLGIDTQERFEYKTKYLSEFK